LKVEFKPPRQPMIYVDIAPASAIGRIAREMTLSEAERLVVDLQAAISVAKAKDLMMRAPA
jgi:hypothetical protein